MGNGENQKKYTSNMFGHPFGYTSETIMYTLCYPRLHLLDRLEHLWDHRVHFFDHHIHSWDPLLHLRVPHIHFLNEGKLLGPADSPSGSSVRLQGSLTYTSVIVVYTSGTLVDNSEAKTCISGILGYTLGTLTYFCRHTFGDSQVHFGDPPSGTIGYTVGTIKFTSGTQK